MAQEYSRIILKRSLQAGVTPTVPTVDDLNQFNGTDIFEGELFWNIPDAKLYTRSGSSIVQLAGDCTVSGSPIEIQVAVSDETTPLSSGDGKVIFRAPCDILVTEVRASLTTADVSNYTVMSIDVEGTSFCEGLTVDAGDRTSVGSAYSYTLPSPPVISDDDEIFLNIDFAAVETTATGLKITIIGTRI
jgi:hypothetical protein